MDFLTIITYALAILETGALLMALVFITKAVKEKKANRQQKKNTPVDKTNYYKSFGFFFVYIILNVIRLSGILG